MPFMDCLGRSRMSTVHIDSAANATESRPAHGSLSEQATYKAKCDREHGGMALGQDIEG